MSYALAWCLLCIYAMWPLYVFTMAMLRAHAAGTVTHFAWVLAIPIVLAAVALDVILNYTLFALLLWDFPKSGEYTFSSRLERLVRGNGWRAKVSRWVAASLLDPYDPSGRHIK